MKALKSAALTVFLFGLLGWVYIAANAVMHPETLPLPLTHFASFPREDTFGAVSFAAAAVAFFVWNLLRD